MTRAPISNNHLIRAAVALLLAVVATVTVNLLSASSAQAAPICNMWAMTDHVDHAGRMYGAGGVNSCRTGVTSYMDIFLYRDGTVVAKAPRTDCRSLPCANSTGQVAISGSHTWCTHVIFYFILPGPPGSTSEREIDCTVT